METEKTFEIKDGEIDIKNIEKQIQKNIIDRKKLGAYSEDVEDLIKRPLLPPPGEQLMTKIDSSTHINYINSYWDIQAEYKISSHRKTIGRLLVWGRRLINTEVRRYVDILIGKQSELNMHIASVLKDSEVKINNVDSKINDINTKINEFDNKINDFNGKTNELDYKIDDFNSKINDFEIKINDIDKEINKTKKEASMKNDYTINYFLFEDKHRGSIEEIKQKQLVYLEYFKNCQNVLDIGCGRGEFLSLLKDNNITGKGIDVDEDMILYCNKNNLNVEKIDAINFLQSLGNKSLDGIFSSQVIEHLQPNELMNLIKLSYDKMQFGSYIAIETINSSCLNAHTTFYKDLSHIRLIPPETLKFLLESVGFKNIEIKFLNIHPDDHRLDKIMKEDNSIDDKSIDIMNKNIDKLNSLLFGYQDYAVVAKK